jgi:hypothetical protein
VLHVTTLQPQQITQILQEAHLWALLMLQTLIFMDNSNFWALVLSELYEYSTPLITFRVKKECSLHRPVLIFQPTVNSSASDKQSELCLQLY